MTPSLPAAVETKVTRIFIGAGMSLLLLTTFSTTAYSDTGLTAPTLLSGIYKVVAVRNASDVAATYDPSVEVESPVGETIGFSMNGITMTGLDCDQWDIEEKTAVVVNLNDPILADINIGPADSPQSAGDQRLMNSYAYSCEGEPFMNVLQVDDRVIVIPWANSSKYLIAEKPLTIEQIFKLQKQLKSMVLLDGKITGSMDEATRLAIRSLAQHRSENPDDYSFFHPALTENLLDTLLIFD